MKKFQRQEHFSRTEARPRDADQSDLTETESDEALPVQVQSGRLLVPQWMKNQHLTQNTPPEGQSVTIGARVVPSPENLSGAESLPPLMDSHLSCPVRAHYRRQCTNHSSELSGKRQSYESRKLLNQLYDPPASLNLAASY